ncbi:MULTISPECIES: type I restriction enzyme HsdR N-terminal domain-containing protein [Thioclava]|uniref:type I restriction enzyme HsdR N-terminal domain-containing protein n=1 Tax=Thioclava TaxID=285107 RepID=UPI000C41BCF0|nr:MULTISPECIES: type I restriction enzyme HsdR N-terminal domain-containing protein [Thioclava]MAQ37245.1 restriction endonuclease [Thioclava sp.]|tara:strand:+ start:198 stop:1241 length:1044 start_codon:yes stop_codon:yes gene_type:complete
MAIENALKQLSDRISQHAATIGTEEAVKTSVVLPFLQALGYDVFNPGEVIPEFTADVIGKKGEKVDYAIKLGDEIRILIECKALNTKLDRRHLAQLYRYFSVTNAKFAILTNGQIYEFYSDLEEPNKLDNKPFFSFDLLDGGAGAIGELAKFEKSSFDVDKILANAERLKHVSTVKKYLLSEFEDPSADFIKLVATHVYDGRITAQVRDAIGSATKFAFREIVRDQVRARLSSALDSSAESEGNDIDPVETNDIETTSDEIEGMMTIRAIVREVIDAKRVDLRDAKSYCAVLVDDNNRKPLARLHFNRKQWYLGLFDGESEERLPINELTDIYQFSERLKETAKAYA